MLNNLIIIFALVVGAIAVRARYIRVVRSLMTGKY